MTLTFRNVICKLGQCMPEMIALVNIFRSSIHFFFLSIISLFIILRCNDQINHVNGIIAGSLSRPPGMPETPCPDLRQGIPTADRHVSIRTLIFKSKWRSVYFIIISKLLIRDPSSDKSDQIGGGGVVMCSRGIITT